MLLAVKKRLALRGRPTVWKRGAHGLAMMANRVRLVLLGMGRVTIDLEELDAFSVGKSPIIGEN